MRRALLASLLLALPIATLATVGCESAVDRRTAESGLEMRAHPVDGAWMITFAGFRGPASNVVVRFGDDREETFRRPTFQLPPDIVGPIDIWLLKYELRGETVLGGALPLPLRPPAGPARQRQGCPRHAREAVVHVGPQGW